MNENLNTLSSLEMVDRLDIESYDNAGRFASYWDQVQVIQRLRPGNILEIGTGSGLLKSYLNRRFAMTSLDHDAALDPDIVASVEKMPLEDSSFDLVACFQVLEHLPFERFPGCLEEIRRMSKKWIFLSFPDCRPLLSLQLKVARRTGFRLAIPIPRLPPEHEFDGNHFWEIGKKDYDLGRITAALTAQKIKLLEHWRVFDFNYHHYFLCEKLD